MLTVYLAPGSHYFILCYFPYGRHHKDRTYANAVAYCKEQGMTLCPMDFIEAGEATGKKGGMSEIADGKKKVMLHGKFKHDGTNVGLRGKEAKKAENKCDKKAKKGKPGRCLSRNLSPTSYLVRAKTHHRVWRHT